MPGIIQRAAIIGGVDPNVSHKFPVRETRPKAGVYIIETEIGRNDQRKFVDISVIDDLE